MKLSKSGVTAKLPLCQAGGPSRSAGSVQPGNGSASAAMTVNTCPLICSNYADHHAIVVNETHTIHHPQHRKPFSAGAAARWSKYGSALQMS